MNEQKLLKPNEGHRTKIGNWEVVFRTYKGETGELVDYMDMYVPPGDGVPLHIHTKNDEIVHVITGDFTFVLGEEESEAPPGAFMYIPRGTQHKFTNVGDTEGHLIGTFTPAGYYDLFVALTAAEENNLDVTEVAAIRKKWGLVNLEAGDQPDASVY